MGDSAVWAPVPLPRWADTEATVGLQDRARTTRRSLLLAVSRLVAEQGFHGTTLNDVTVASGTTKGALYFHFPSKLTLAEALVAEVFACWDDLLARIEALDLEPLFTLLVSYDTYTCRLLYDVTARGCLRILRDEPVLAHHARDWSARWEKVVAGHLRRAHDDGLLRDDVDPDGVSRLVLAAATGHFQLSDGRSGPDMWERMNDTWNGLLPAVATPRWVTTWRTSGWSDRLRPAPEDFHR